MPSFGDIPYFLIPIPLCDKLLFDVCKSISPKTRSHIRSKVMIPDNKKSIIKQNDNQKPLREQKKLFPQFILDDEALADMAADPEIQNEIALINAEFAETEEDGLSDES
jgi:hypothetical protein